MLLRDRYEPLEIVARGGQGELIRARDRLHDRIVAIKARAVGDADGDGVLREARTLLGLPPHPGVSLVREDFFEGDRYHLVMEWVEGAALDRLVAERGPLALEEVARVATQVADALEHVHVQGVVHGDVKPANVIVRPDGHAVLVDFGIAARAGDAGPRPGTTGFRAPEVAGGEDPTPAADVFGLAATVFALLTGAPPSPGPFPDLTPVAGSNAAVLERVLRAGLAFDAARRPASVREIVECLRPPEVPTNLPAPVTPFIGREDALRALRPLLRDTRLLTLVGVGGAGKTRLAIELATAARAEHPDGAWFVDLAPVADPTLVAPALAQAVGAREDVTRSPLEAAQQLLAGARALVVLDNCEHLIDECARVADSLLRACRNLRILATSREALDMLGEIAWPVPPMTFPDDSFEGTAGDASSYESVRLFVDRARRAAPGFALTDDLAPAVGRIAWEVDGIPLAIELAAALVRTLRVEDIAAGLDARLELLTSGNRGAPERQRTLRATIEWSHALLSDDERVLFRRLGIFAGGFSPSRIEPVCGIGNHERRLRSLADKSLLARVATGGAERYRMLETVREYALERLVEADEMDAIGKAHQDHYLAFIEGTLDDVGGFNRHRALASTDVEVDNIRAAMARSIVSGDDVALRFAYGLYNWWATRGRGHEAIRFTEDALAAAPDAPIDSRLRGLWVVARFAGWLADADKAVDALRRRAELARQSPRPEARALALMELAGFERWDGDLAAAAAMVAEAKEPLERGLAGARAPGMARRTPIDRLLDLAWIATATGDPDRGRVLKEEALADARAWGDPVFIWGAHRSLAHHEYAYGDPDRAKALLDEMNALSAEPESRWTVLEERAFAEQALGRYDEARALLHRALEFHALDTDLTVASTLLQLGQIEQRAGDLDAARASFERCAGVAREAGETHARRMALGGLGEVLARQGEIERAVAPLAEGLDLAERGREPEHTVLLFFGVAALATASGDTAAGAEMLGAARALRGRYGEPLTHIERDAFEHRERMLRARLRGRAFDRAHERGRGIGVAGAFALARRVLEDASSARAGRRVAQPST